MILFEQCSSWDACAVELLATSPTAYFGVADVKEVRDFVFLIQKYSKQREGSYLWSKLAVFVRNNCVRFL